MCNSHDIIILQETWLTHDELYLLKNVNSNFHASGVSSMVTDQGILNGRPHGGLGVLWNKNLGDAITIRGHNERLMSLNFTHNDHSFLLLNIYMPYDDRSSHSDNYELFMSLLGDVYTIADEHPTSSVIIMGGWNSNVISGSVFGRELENFCTEYKYIISDMELLGRNSGTLTFYSESHHVTTWIDHCVCSWQAHTSISDINILYDIQCSDHFPIS